MHKHELIGIVNRQFAKKQRIKHRKNRSVRADSQRQRDHRRRGEAGILGQHSQAELYVLPERVHQCFPVMPTSLEKFRRARVHPPRKLVWEGSASLDMVRIQLVTSSCAGRVAFEKAKGDRVSEKRTWDAVIVGAGHNGLVTAAYLSRAGLKVLVLERREVLGGACVTEEIFPGYKFSTAAYLCSLMQEQIIRELDLPRYGYQVYAKDPAFFTPFPDGRHLTMWQDRAKTCEEIAKFSKKDAETYPKYEDFVERLSEFAESMLMRTPPNITRTNWSDLAALGKLGWEASKMPDEERIGQVRIFTQSVAEFLEPWFESEELKVTLATDGVIGTNGGPRSPGTAYVLLHHVMGKVDGHRGLWGFVRGGMGAISQSIASARASPVRRFVRMRQYRKFWSTKAQPVRGRSEWYSITAKKFTRAL